MRNKVFLLFMFGFLSTTQTKAETWAIMRHGLSLKNVLNVHNGDVKNSEKYPLTKEGQAQARHSAETLKLELGGDQIATVYVSPLLRARQTAQIVMETLGVPPSKLKIEPLVREVGFGDLEEKPSQGGEHLPSSSWSDLSYAPEYHGESQPQLQDRLSQFIANVKSARHQGVVLVVTHGGPAQALIKLLDQSAGNIQLNTAGFRTIQTQE